MSDLKLEWAEPPASRGVGRKGTSKYREVAEELRRNPGQWARIGRFSSATSHVITKGKASVWLPAGSFESVTRNYDRATRTSDIYVRYVGTEVAE